MINNIKKIAFKAHDKATRLWLSIRGIDFSPDDTHATGEVARCTSVPIAQTLEALARVNSPARYIFYDIGAGKGYVAYHAAKKNFARVVGIEIVDELASVAILNISKLRNQRCAQVEIMACDVLEFRYPDSDSVFYFFNPFPSAIFSQCIRRIMAQIQRSDLLIILVHPVSDAYTSILEKLGFSMSEQIDHGFTRTLIYKANKDAHGK